MKRKANRDFPEYRVWRSMRERCNNKNHPAYARYGGRGIKVCRRWDSFRAFLQDVGLRPTSRHTIERTKNSKGYYPGNVKWATATEQGRNRRSNTRLTYGGQTKTLAAWAEVTGIKSDTIGYRVKKLNWPVAKALTTPVKA